MRPIFAALLAALPAAAGAGEPARATFAGGCFWCMEPPFEKLPGVSSVISGYIGGPEVNPTYREVAGGKTGHLEAVQVTFDPETISYERLLEVYWMQFDPTDAGGSFVDRGHQYTSAVFVHDEEQRRLAEESRAALAASGRFEDPIVTPVRDAEVFYPAEEYHQDFYRKDPAHYRRYRSGSGRDEFIRAHWSEEGFMRKLLHYYGRMETDPDDYERVEAAYRSGTGKQHIVNPAKAHVNRHLRDGLGARRAAPYLIVPLGTIPGTRRQRFGLRIPPHAIRIRTATGPAASVTHARRVGKQ